MFDIDDGYIKEIPLNYWAEYEEMKKNIHPSQIIERAQKVLDESNINGKISFMDYNNFSGMRVGVSLDGNFYGVFDYIENIFESIPESRLTETLEMIEMGGYNK